MKICVTRDSVCAADDIHAPHVRRVSIPDDWTWKLLVHHACDSLPRRISGGKATWGLCSNIPLAVAAQQWKAPRLLRLTASDRDRLQVTKGQIRLHWSYFQQLEPKLVREVLQSLRLRCPTV